MTTASCRRKVIADAYLAHAPALTPHNCCDNCEKVCGCGSEDCPRRHIIKEFNVPVTESSDEQDLREISDEQYVILRQKLDAYKATLAAGDVTSVSDELTHGLTYSVLDTIVDHAKYIFSVEDLMEHARVWSYSMASSLFDIFITVFDDVQQPTDSESNSD